MTDAISRSALQKEFDEKCLKDCAFCPFYVWIMDDSEADGGYCGLVEKAPALDVAPVVHARWVNGKCSRCKTAVLDFSHKENDGFGAVTVGNGDYCSNCGARMDGEAE